MVNSQYAEELEVALAAVHRASIVTKDVMRGIDAFDKSDASPVTVADFAAQALIICAVHNKYPNDSFIAEESADMLRGDSAALDRVWALVSSSTDFDDDLGLPSSKDDMMRYIDMGSSPEGPRPGRIWILDPIDGTATFMKSQQYAVCLCLTVDGEQKVAALGCPNLRPDEQRVEEDLTDKKRYGLMVYAVAGQGTFKAPLTRRNILPESPVKRVNKKIEWDQLQVIDSVKSSHADIPAHTKVYQSLGVVKSPVDIWSQQMKYIALAFGACDAMIRMPPKLTYRACVWDHAGGQLIFQEAGGKLTDMYGRKFQFGVTRQFQDNCGYIASDEDAHGVLLDTVTTVLAQRDW